jgi:hypothetical protein
MAHVMIDCGARQMVTMETRLYDVHGNFVSSQGMSPFSSIAPDTGAEHIWTFVCGR